MKEIEYIDSGCICKRKGKVIPLQACGAQRVLGG
jgi:hypothetical protein